jgi:hypothetical protein
VRTGAGLGREDAAQLVQHPVLGGIEPLQVLLGSARHCGGGRSRRASEKTLKMILGRMHPQVVSRKRRPRLVPLPRGRGGALWVWCVRGPGPGRTFGVALGGRVSLAGLKRATRQMGGPVGQKGFPAPPRLSSATRQKRKKWRGCPAPSAKIAFRSQTSLKRQRLHKLHVRARQVAVARAHARDNRHAPHPRRSCLFEHDVGRCCLRRLLWRASVPDAFPPVLRLGILLEACETRTRWCATP